ncbi:MAG TPA: lysophospholipid acyltransferase family protein [Dongiaceae bacterium]|jgi:1-acyl-sn-glycerol-3-phosphate acyltransferase|nr:lysophospholipid acyltransferase family protein [Dongiaceae bacterium]
MVLLTAALDFFITFGGRGRRATIPARAAWMHKHARRVLASLHVRVTVHGTPPQRGLLACNHLSYVDILVLGKVQPMVFLSKSEVRSWPIFGWLTRLAGTLFVRRNRRSDVAQFDESFAAVVNSGVVLGLFPEGTSSDGARVLRFHSSLFEPAIAAGWPVTGAWIGYTLREGSVGDDVAYWGDMTFFPHMLKLLTLPEIAATVAYGSAAPAGLSRKELAQALQHQVCGLLEQHRPAASAETRKIRTPAGAHS